MIANNNILCMDIGSKYIKLVEGKPLKNKTMIYKMVKARTPVGAFSDGNILDAAAISKEISTLIRENNIRAIRVVFVLQSSNMIMRRLQVPNAKKNELKKIIKIELEEETPLSLDEYIVEYKKLGKVEDHKVEVAAFALPEKLVDEYVQLLKNLKLRPYILDVHVNNIVGLFRKGLNINDENINREETVAFIDIGGNSTSVVIIKDLRVEFSRIVALGGLEIDQALARQYDLTLEAAEQMKIELMACEENDESFEDPEALERLRFIRKNIGDLVEEISRIMGYYLRIKSDNNIDRIYIAGGCSKIRDFEKVMEEETRVPAHKVQKLNDFEIADGRTLEEVYEYVNAMIAIRKR